MHAITDGTTEKYSVTRTFDVRMNLVAQSDSILEGGISSDKGKLWELLLQWHKSPAVCHHLQHRHVELQGSCIRQKVHDIKYFSAVP